MSDEPIDRRSFGAGVAASIAAATLLSRSDAEAQPRPPPRPVALRAAPGEKALLPLPFAPGALVGLSERLLRSHHENNYAGAVRKLNEIRQQLTAADPDAAGGYWSLFGSLKAAELAARNSAYLHELYFANLAPPVGADGGVTVPATVAEVLAARFGSVERFGAVLRGAGKASSGWVVLALDRTSHTLEVIQTDGHASGAWDAVPLIVLDMFEHSYAIDHGAAKGPYLAAFWRNLHWGEVERRLTRALRAAD